MRRGGRRQAGKAPEPTVAILGSQTVKSTETGGDRGWDGGKRIKGRKRHLCTDTLGLPLEVWVTAANVSDGEIGAELPDHVKGRIRTLQKVYVDQAYRGLVEDVGQDIGVAVEVVRRSLGQKGFQFTA